MRSIIHFRSREASRQTGLGSLKKIRNYGSEYESIRPAIPSDDARNIAWKQSARSDVLAVKSHEDSANIDIELVGISDMSWDFSIENHDDKKTFYQKLHTLCHQSAMSLRYDYKEYLYTTEDIGEVSMLLKGRKLQKKLLLFVLSDLRVDSYRELAQLAYTNDILVIHLLHPYEKYPEKYRNILLESSCIREEEYKQKLRDTEESIKTFLLQSGISFLPATSTDDSEKLLNYFFKHRYDHHSSHRSRISP